MTELATNARLLRLADRLDAFHAAAAAVPQEQHREPPEELVREAYCLAAAAIDLALALEPMLPPTPHYTEAEIDRTQTELEAHGPVLHHITEELLEDDPRTILKCLVLDLARTGPLMRSGCSRPLRPRCLCYEPLLAELASDARRLAALLAA